MFWEMVGGMVGRTCSNSRLARVQQVVHQVQALTHYFPPTTVVSILEQALAETPDTLHMKSYQVSSPVGHPSIWGIPGIHIPGYLQPQVISQSPMGSFHFPHTHNQSLPLPHTPLHVPYSPFTPPAPHIPVPSILPHLLPSSHPVLPPVPKVSPIYIGKPPSPSTSPIKKSSREPETSQTM